jgi:small subunit ribosomal protein S2
VALISLRQLLECGVHFGHPTRKWNPKMNPYIYTKRNGIHILDLQQTTKLIDDTHAYVHELVSAGKNILFVGTKKQAQDAIREEATKCGMPYVNQRWLGGLLTNRLTIRARIERLRDLRRQKETGELETLTKQDRRFAEEELGKLEKFLGGMADLNGLPDALFIVDVKKEAIAVLEARKLKIPIIGILDTNCDPDDVDFKLPGNDDAIRSIRLFCQIIADSVMEAKYGYLPPDSVFIRAAETEEDSGSGASAPASAPAAAPAPAAPAPAAPTLAQQPLEPSTNGSAEEPAASIPAAPELGRAGGEVEAAADSETTAGITPDQQSVGETEKSSSDESEVQRTASDDA